MRIMRSSLSGWTLPASASSSQRFVSSASFSGFLSATFTDSEKSSSMWAAPVAVSAYTVSRASGVLTANNHSPPGLIARGRTCPVSKFVNVAARTPTVLNSRSAHAALPIIAPPYPNRHRVAQGGACVDAMSPRTQAVEDLSETLVSVVIGVPGGAAGRGGRRGRHVAAQQLYLDQGGACRRQVGIHLQRVLEVAARRFELLLQQGGHAEAHLPVGGLGAGHQRVGQRRGRSHEQL